jgi:hypothetical protein
MTVIPTCVRKSRNNNMWYRALLWGSIHQFCLLANIVTLCQPDRPLIKYPQHPDVLHAFNFKPHNILLQFDLWIMVLNPALKKLHKDSLVFPHWVVFLKTRPFVKPNNAEFKNVSISFSSHVQHIPYTFVQDTSFFSPHQQTFFPVCVFWSPQRVSLVGPV